MKFKILLILLSLIIINPKYSYSASSNGGSSNNEKNLYNEAKRFVIRAKKLEKKNKVEKAIKLYSKAYDKLIIAYEKDKQNADILNYLGFTLRKSGNFKKAEFFYLKGLELDSAHLGINEYLGELYVETNRIDLAKERLNVLKGCNCEEYEELKELIEKK